ncbi:MAG: hypothetical protein ACK5AO_08560, partial [bacterium]
MAVLPGNTERSIFPENKLYNITHMADHKETLSQRGLYPSFIFFSCLVFMMIISSCSNKKDRSEWNVTGGSKENIRYSSLSQIDTSNVDQLEVAWVYRSEGGDSTRFGPMQCNPIVVNNILYG